MRSIVFEGKTWNKYEELRVKNKSVHKNLCKILKEMQNEFYEIVTDPIRINSKIREAPLAKKSIFSYDKNSRGAKDYALLVKSVINDEALYTGKKTNTKIAAAA